MGQTPSRAEIRERDVLTLCDDGDLLLLRERVQLPTLRVAVDQRVVQDIAWFQQGVAPTTRLTQLPAWTSCAVLLRLRGVLHFLEVDVDGMRLVPFQPRVTDRTARRGSYAIRRLQQHVHNDTRSAFLRQLTSELSQVLPLEWNRLSMDTVQLLDATLRAHARVQTIVTRMLQLCGPSLESAHVSASVADCSAQLATAVAIAIYEELHLLERTASSVEMLTPSRFACPSTDKVLVPSTTVLCFTPPTALGLEMRLV